MKLINAMRTKDTVTENGMAAHSTTLNFCVDLFSQIGSMRINDKDKKINIFTKAFGEDPLTAMKILFWVRDIRGGAGERQTFKDIIVYLANNHTETLRKNLDLIPEYGRWDDLLVLLDTKLKSDVLDIISNEFKGAKDGESLLIAKWLPRFHTKNSDKKRWANIIRKHLGLKHDEYRKMLSKHSNTVEQLMCSNKWGKINYEQVPSKAMSNYMRTFIRHDNHRFNEYLESVKSGDKKINTKTLYPYDVFKNCLNGDENGANLQWEEMPNFLEGSNEKILPVVDVSGSMFWPESRISGDLYAGDVAMSLGLYVSERNIGPFKDAVINFHTNPKLYVLKGSFSDRVKQIKNIKVGGSTNINGVFDLILKKAVEFNVPESEMPTMIIIFSDMQFDSACNSSWYEDNVEWNPTVQELVKKKYLEAGYKLPKLVYWQLNARLTNQPVQYDETGTSLVSGFSPNILISLLKGEEITPYKIMLETINNKRYDQITV